MERLGGSLCGTAGILFTMVFLVVIVLTDTFFGVSLGLVKVFKAFSVAFVPHLLRSRLPGL